MRMLLVEADFRKFPELEKLRKELGAEGYGVWWLTVQLLAIYRKPIPINYKALAKIVIAPERIVKMVIEDYGLFVIENGKVWNPDLDVCIRETSDGKENDEG